MNKADYKNIWIFAETDEQGLKPCFHELLAKAYQLREASNRSAKLAAVLIGSAGAEVPDELKNCGVELIYHITHNKLASYNPEYYAMAFAEAANAFKPEAIWIGATSIGSELAPSVAGKLKTGLAAHCVDIFMNDGQEYVNIVPAFGGKVLSEILIPNHRPAMASVKPGTFEKADIPACPEVEVIAVSAACLDEYQSAFENIGVIINKQDRLPVDKAQLVICGGIGIGSEEVWAKAKKFAAAVKGTIGYTRPMVDIGLESDETNMIGTSGKSIRPKMYVGFGVSGASHHVCGIKDSDTIIAVNTDESADIFNASNVKIVADCDDILSALLKELEIEA